MEMYKFQLDSTDICYQGSNQKYSSIGSDKGLAPSRRQAIIWTNVGIGHQRLYASLGLNELTGPMLCRVTAEQGSFQYKTIAKYTVSNYKD